MTTKPSSASTLTLRAVTAESLRTICKLAVLPEQERNVAPNVFSIAEASFHEHAWPRAIYADETPVGFVMLGFEPKKRIDFVWRFMIDARYQGLGFGRTALRLVVEHVRKRADARVLELSVVQTPGNPQPFYEAFGFQATDVLVDDERVMRLPLRP